MPSARSILTLWKPSSFMKCSWPGLICALNRSVMRATSSALASSTDSSLGLMVPPGASCGAATTVRASAVSGFVMMLIFSWLLFGRHVVGGSDGGAILLQAVFLVGGDQHVLVAVLRHPAEL